ncbi:MAG: winged helix-turn-helix transcriptional regulator [Catenulispora sp.]|nr:winged helix-turn-helix transcriptional regulator [Catenulispora sp.]
MPKTVNLPSPADDVAAEVLAEHLRTAVSALVRNTRAGDRLAPIPSAALDLIDRQGPMTTADLAASRGVRHQTMAATVKDLSGAGYLTTRPDPADARKKVLVLTDLGKGAIEADRRHRVALLAEAVELTLDGDDRLVLAQALELIDRIAEAVARRDERDGEGS